MKYLVMEIQTFENGSMSTPTYAYDTRLSAESKYHAILSAAAVSALPDHAAVMMTSDGRLIANQAYHHEITPPEPEPEDVPDEGEES